MTANRQEIAASASTKIAAATLASAPVLIGLDGFVDSIIDVVDKRTSPTSYDRVKTIAHFGQKISAAAGESANYEFVITLQKLGGNGPIMANAMASFGLPTTYVGNLGYPALQAVFEPMTKHATVISIADPGFTDALEFDDGKLMLGKHQTLRDVTWENLVARAGLDKLTAAVDHARLIAMTNWTMLPFMSDIWSKLYDNVITKVVKKDRFFFADLADPEKRTKADLVAAMNLLTKFQSTLNVILGLNLKEAIQVAAALDLQPFANPEAAIEEMAIVIRKKLNINTVVIHPRKGAAAATPDASASFAGPFVQFPKISTGAGDHFNAGFVTGRLLGLTLAESLANGTATSGYYVRNAASPTRDQLAAFLKELPAPQA